MRWLIAALVLACRTCLAGDASVVAWNLEWFPGGSPSSSPQARTVHMSAAKDALLQISPDIFCAQELRDWDVFAELVSVAPRLKPLVVSAYRDSPRGGSLSIQQVGIAAVFPAVGAWSESFRVSAHTPPRGFSFAALDMGTGKRLLVYSVHLKSNRGEPAEDAAKREDAARQIAAHAAKMEKDYAPVLGSIVCGDFNTDPTDAQFAGESTFMILADAGFRWAWENTPKGERITHPGNGKYPPASFDHFLVKGGIAVESCRPLPVSGVSDHRPVELKISW